MAMFENLLSQSGGRQSGTPFAQSIGGNSGASFRLQPSSPAYPAPPSPSAGQPGRPSSRPAMPSAPVGGFPVSRPPAAPAPSPAPTSPPGAPQPPTAPTAPKTKQPSIPDYTTSPVTTPPPQPPRTKPDGTTAPTTPVTNAIASFNRVPTRSDMAGLMPGVEARTPYGRASLGPDGRLAHTFDSPEAEQRYNMDQASYANRFGPTPLSSFPGAPTPPITLGRPAWNPWSGTWLTPDK